jgi:heat shock protein HslJ
MDQENRYQSLLSAAQKYQIVGCTLQIETKDGKVLRFMALTQSALEGPTWVLEAFGDPKRLALPLAGTEITAHFGGSPQGTVTGSAGCNGYFGGYRVDGENLSIGAQLGATDKFCADPPGLMDQEARYEALLVSAQRYRVTGSTLEITTKDGLLLRFAAR